MRKIFLMLSVSLFSLNAEAQECVDAPSCTELGYTQTEADCPNGAVKCPWNTGLVFCGCGEDYQYSCDDANEIAGNSKCGDYYTSCNCASGYEWKEGRCVSSRPKCNIGDIFYTDNTCTSAANYNSSKTVLGVVVYVNPDGVGGQIMAKAPINENGKEISLAVTTPINWCNNYSGDIPNLDSYTVFTVETDYNSCSNTDKIVAAGNDTIFPAAWAARKYAPTPETAGKWCLPSAGTLSRAAKINSLDSTLMKIGGYRFKVIDTKYWTSTRNSGNSVYYGDWASKEWSIGTCSRTLTFWDGIYVRPVMEF